MERFHAILILKILSPKIHDLLTLSVGGDLSTCQLPGLAGVNPKSFKEVRSRSRVLELPFTTNILKTDRTYLYKQFVNGVRLKIKQLQRGRGQGRGITFVH